MKIKIVKENIMKEQEAKPAVMIVGGFELFGQAQANARLVDRTSKIIKTASKEGSDLAALKDQAAEELRTWAASNGYQITKEVMDDK
jgi:hypothetical protein